ncbi:hypothetical protein LX99_05105 [Mucilaginibacter oryzae]|uniref:Uncharacterized protein n=1 Tax=Mucilaginibacter oryzae TaxID=468058 RepID=A0A316GTH6_9SPHI|nr:hypothetical protein [Mucilaginibacter oryzae]PWK64059.1 hypothetical protein LX99_05105 [Mucilaginibacter oryzae]
MIFLIILISSFISSFFLPWWTSCIIAFFTAFLIGKTEKQAFWSGFFSQALVWLILIIISSLPNQFALAGRVSSLFHLPHWSFLVLLTILLGGVAGGLPSLSGFLIRQWIKKVYFTNS